MRWIVDVVVVVLRAAERCILLRALATLMTLRAQGEFRLAVIWYEKGSSWRKQRMLKSNFTKGRSEVMGWDENGCILDGSGIHCELGVSFLVHDYYGS